MMEAARVGIVVPSGNAAAETEIGCLVRPEMNSHTMRFPHMPERGLADRLHTYNEILPETIGGFGRLALDAVVVACSGSHYLLGPDEDGELCAKLSADTGRPVASSTIATLDTCADLGVRDLVLASPYEPWLTDHSLRYWEAAGLRVRTVIPIRAGGRFSPYDVATDELVRQVQEADPGGDAALLFTGTGMFTFAALTAIGTGNDRILLTSNVCSAWWARRQTGRDTPADGSGHWLLRRLAERAGPQ